MTDPATGGCQCGRVRFVAEADGAEAYRCHCTMCRRATGGAAAAFVNVARAAVQWKGVVPDRYRSSPIHERGFCAACGTPLSFAYPDSDRIDLTLGAFDESERFAPAHHFSSETWLTAWLDTSHLPAQRLDSDALLAARWVAARG